MKRTPSAGYAGGTKKVRVEEEDYEGGSFEEELMAMDNAVVECEEGEETSEARVSRWSRPDCTVEGRFPKESLVFQWFDIDLTSGQPMSKNPAGGDIVGSSEGPVPLVRLYGVTQDGFSVLAHVHGFTPYFFVSLPASTDISENALGLMRVTLDQNVSHSTLFSLSSVSASHHTHRTVCLLFLCCAVLHFTIL